jgi:hypothetical protein
MNNENHGTLREEFPLHKACDNLPLYSLKLAMLPGEGRRAFTHMLKHLSRIRCRKIGELLDLKWADIEGTDGLGETSYFLLLDLLKRILDDPSLIVDIEAAAKSQRIEAIKKRLRDMGMIN